MNAAILLIAVALANFGWQGFADKPRAGAAFAYLLGFVLFALHKAQQQRGSAMALVCSFGLVAEAAGLSCVLWYEQLASKTVGVCDEGTGLPVGLAFGVALLLVAAEFKWGGAKP